MKKSKVFIIAGKWRHQPVEFLAGNMLRPTPNRIRETLFNWLAFEIIGTNVLDLFAGSGILAFEALSRGAKSATLVEKSKKNYQQLQQQSHKLSHKNTIILCQDALDYLPEKHQQLFDIVFLDPPFGGYDTATLLKQIILANVLRPRSKIYLESQTVLTKDQLPTPMTILKQKQASRVHYVLLNYIPN